MDLLETLRCDERAVWIDGERVKDVTSDPRFAGAARTLAELYDLPDNGDLSYRSPLSGNPVRLSWLEPKSREGTFFITSQQVAPEVVFS